jgi:putative DNA-binding protein
MQRLLTDAVRRALPIAEDEALSRRVQALVLPSPRGMGPLERLEVYREQFWLRHLPNLEEDCPTLAWAVGGRDAFQRLATEYLVARPPQTWNLAELGANLASYVASHAPWCDDAIACDAARLDRAFTEAFEAPDAPPFDPAVIASAPENDWANALVMFHPSLRAVALAYPLHELRDAAKRREVPARPSSRAANVIVWRDAACFLHAATVEPVAFALLVALHEGVPLGEACAVSARAGGFTDPLALGPRVGQWFQEWTSSGWVSTLRFRPTY